MTGQGDRARRLVERALAERASEEPPAPAPERATRSGDLDRPDSAGIAVEAAALGGAAGALADSAGTAASAAAFTGAPTGAEAIGQEAGRGRGAAPGDEGGR